MDKDEAWGILNQEIQRLRATPYEELNRLRDQPETAEIKGASGTTYQVERQAFGDASKRDPNLRVMASVDDGGWRAFAPITDSFVITPDGSFAEADVPPD